MPHEITNHSAILDAIRRASIISELVEKDNGHFKYELDLEVIVYGRNYTGKKVGPYLQLLVYEPGEEIIRQGDWGGNAFFISIEGNLDVYATDTRGSSHFTGVLRPGTSFGEGPIFAGIPHQSTVVVPQGVTACVLKIMRPALRLLRKLPKFGSQLDDYYHNQVLHRTLEELRQRAGSAFNHELLDRLSKASRVMIYGKHHVLFREGDPIERIIFIVNGWLRRARELPGQPPMSDITDTEPGWHQNVDFLGAGNCLGLEGVPADTHWSYTATILQRTEVLELSVVHIRSDVTLRDALRQSFLNLSLSDDETWQSNSATDKLVMAATEKEIVTGIVDGTNLLVMDMDLCVRCGNCSLACHKVHGRSRLMRRGIHIKRPVSLSGLSEQHVLSPSVCMHCQDPECMTGCPTGSIARFSDGRIDIDAKTCIGCGDCAVQCPYNAISMVPRREPIQPSPPWTARFKQWFKLSPSLPSPVTDIENLTAVTCNLCENTPLNPSGARKKAYSCEENCPTGALVRVNPLEYFAEAGNRIGLVFRDHTHAIGRNIHKHDPVAKLFHAAGLTTTLALTFAVVWGLLRYSLNKPICESWLTMRWLTGLAGLGFVAAASIYSARRKIYKRRVGPLRYWMLAHVYAGSIGSILLLFHAGSSSGGIFTSVLTASLYLTLFSGLLGVACYLICPRILTSIESEPLLIEDLRERREELRGKLAAIDGSTDPGLRSLIKTEVHKRFFTLRFLLRQYIRREDLSKLLVKAREDVLSRLKSLPDRQSSDLLLESVESAVIMRRVDALIYLHLLLKLWLVPHVLVALILVMLMFVHIIQVVFYAAR